MMTIQADHFSGPLYVIMSIPFGPPYAPTVCLDRPGVFGLGVADGVYMWKTKGIDSGLFSRTLMSSARESVKTGMNDVVKCKHRSTPLGEGFLLLTPFPSFAPAPSCTVRKTAAELPIVLAFFTM